jgi:hypothetical protein
LNIEGKSDMTIIKPRRPWRQPSNAAKRIGLDLGKLRLSCHSCEKPLNHERPPTDVAVYFQRDGSVGVALVCRSCAEAWFNAGAFTLPLSSIEGEV